MYGNGVMIGMMKNTARIAPKITHRVQIVVNIALSVAVLGASIRGTAVLPIASGAIQATGSTTSVSVLFRRTCNALYPFSRRLNRMRPRLKSWVAIEAHDFNRGDKKKKENANRFNGLYFGKKRL